MWVAALIVFPLIFLPLGYYYGESVSGRNPSEAQGWTWDDRLAAIEEAWEAARDDEATQGGCPTVDALERSLPPLRGVDGRERDYVAMMRGEQC